MDVLIKVLPAFFLTNINSLTKASFHLSVPYTSVKAQHPDNKAT